MVQSRVPATIDALVAIFKAAQGQTWETYDGPPVTGDFTDAVFVGYDAHPDSEFRSIANHVQAWAGLGKSARSETFSVVCSIAVLVGDENGQKAARDKAYLILEALGAALRADPSLGQPPPFVASLMPNEMYTEATTSGSEVRIPFFVDIQISRV